MLFESNALWAVCFSGVVSGAAPVVALVRIGPASSPFRRLFGLDGPSAERLSPMVDDEKDNR